MSADIKATTVDARAIAPSSSSGNQDIVANKSQAKGSWKGVVWDAWDKGPEERRLLWKLDICLILMGFLGTVVKHIDQANLTNAFVSGMEEDLSLYGNQMTYASTSYSVAYCVGMFPVNLLLTRSNPRYFIAFLEFGWALSTFGQAVMKNATQMYALRALVGLFECGHFSAFMFLCGAWYKKRELSRRVALINCAVHIGPMISSYFQAAAYDGLNGVGGRAGWRWAFLIDGILSVGIVIPAVLLLPDVPARQKPDYVFTAAEVELARKRNPREGRVKQGAFTRRQLFRFLFTPEIWLLWTISVVNGIGSYPTNSIAYWFKAWNTREPGSFTVAEINDYVTPVYAITLVLDVTFAWLSDTWLKGKRWPMLVVAISVQALVCILLAATPVFPHNKKFRWFLYYQTGWIEASSTLFWAWTQDILSGDPAVRAVASGGLNLWSSVFTATIPLAVFQTVQQPGVVAGNWTAMGFCFAGIIAVLSLAYIEKRKKGKGGIVADDDDEADVIIDSA